MASSNSTQSTPARSDREPLRTVSMDYLIGLIDDLAGEIDEKINQVAAIAYGGAAHAGHIKGDGNEIDCTSKHMFNVIVEMTGEASAHYSLKDAIAELRFRASEPGKQAQ